MQSRKFDSAEKSNSSSVDSLSLLFAPSLLFSEEDDEGEDDKHRGDVNGAGGGGSDDDAAAVDVEGKDALLFKLELALSLRRIFLFLVALVASTLAPLPSPLTFAVPSRVVLRRRFCRPLFCFDELPEEHTLPFSATPSDEDDSNDDDDGDGDFCTFPD